MSVERIQGYEPKYDIKEYDFTKDLAFGHQGEEIVKGFLTNLSEGSFEVKYDRFRNGRIFVEYEQNPRGAGWKPSGISVSTARWLVYLFSPSSFCVIEIPRLKRYLRKNKDRLKRVTAAPNTENPAHGFLLFPNDVQELMTSAEYDG